MISDLIKQAQKIEEVTLQYRKLGQQWDQLEVESAVKAWPLIREFFATEDKKQSFVEATTAEQIDMIRLALNDIDQQIPSSMIINIRRHVSNQLCKIKNDFSL